MRHNRRDFLKTTTASVAVAAPYVWTSSYARARDANSKPTVAGIGLGGSRGTHSRGRGIASQAAQLGKIIAVCDVDEQHTAEFNTKFDNKLNQYVDYRVLLEKEQPDVVTIGTPINAYLRADAVDIVQPDITRVGGLTPFLKIASICHAAHRSVEPHLMMEASVHLACGLPAVVGLEFMPWLTRAFTEPPVVENGHLSAPTTPGLGLSITPETLDKYRLA